MRDEAHASQAHSEMLQQCRAPFVVVLEHSLFTMLSRSTDELEVGEGYAPAGRGQGADALAGKVGFGRSLLKLAAVLEIAQLARRRGKAELGFPDAPGKLPLHDHDVSHCSNTE